MPTVTRAALGGLNPQAAASAVIDALARGDRPEAKRIIEARPKAHYALPGGGLYPWLDASDTWGETVGLCAVKAWHRLDYARTLAEHFDLAARIFAAADAAARDAAIAGAGAGWRAAGGAPEVPGAWAALDNRGAAEASGPLGAFGDALAGVLLAVDAIATATDAALQAVVLGKLRAAEASTLQGAAALAKGADAAARELWGADALTVIRAWQQDTFDPEAGELWAAVAGVALTPEAEAEAEAIAGAMGRGWLDAFGARGAFD